MGYLRILSAHFHQVKLPLYLHNMKYDSSFLIPVENQNKDIILIKGISYSNGNILNHNLEK